MSESDPKRSWHWIEVLILSLAHVGLRRGQRGEGHSFHVSAMGHLVRSLEGQQSLNQADLLLWTNGAVSPTLREIVPRALTAALLR
jgi:hypothetical protein